MEQFTSIPRNLYMNRILRFIDNENVLFVVGVRRVGKSSIARQLEENLRARFSDSAQIVRISFEAAEAGRAAADDLLALFKEQRDKSKRGFLLLDEMTHIADWEKIVNYICKESGVKVILFSSNRRVVSEELTAVQENKYDVVPVLPLSLPEFILFQGFQEVTGEETPLLEKQYRRPEGRTYTIREIYKFYTAYGGLPVLKPDCMDAERARVVLDGTYSSVVMRDILELGSSDKVSAITDPVLLRTVITIMANTIGDNISATRIGKQTADYLQRTSSTKTIESYLRALLNAHLFYVAERYDIRADKPLKTLAKYYIVDAGLRNYLTGLKAEDENRILENMVFFELLRRGYQVNCGKFGSEEISLFVRNGNERFYIQVADLPYTDGMEKMLSPLRKIRDNHPKLIITPDSATYTLKDGIVVQNALEFLMGKAL